MKLTFLEEECCQIYMYRWYLCMLALLQMSTLDDYVFELLSN